MDAKKLLNKIINRNTKMMKDTNRNFKELDKENKDFDAKFNDLDKKIQRKFNNRER
ncbi:hypothetical protein [Lactiplantibacillus plantarum]|uniref:hypothetical protein n=1 Tax=Lactiplantibacillus plantarum TaxID=1590 RepID=UPI0022404944|nr:hypothetical protein [Lactiplantibacillus plantarum]